MTIAKLFLSSSIFFSLFAKSQTVDSLIGKWKFREIYKSEKMDSTELKFLRGMFAGMTLYIKPNKHYKTFLFKNEEGSWSFDELERKLTMSANKGTESQLELITVTANDLVVSLGKDKAFILERTTVVPNDEIEEKITARVLMSATSKQICKKWYLLRRDVPGRTAAQSKAVTELVGETFFNFQPDNTYQSQVLSIKVEGNWKFGPGNTSLILAVDDSKITWHIKSINENELVLLRGNTEETWTFTPKH